MSDPALRSLAIIVAAVAAGAVAAVIGGFLTGSPGWVGGGAVLVVLSLIGLGLVRMIHTRSR